MTPGRIKEAEILITQALAFRILSIIAVLAGACISIYEIKWGPFFISIFLVWIAHHWYPKPSSDLRRAMNRS